MTGKIDAYRSIMEETTMGQTRTGRCSSGACVEVKEVDGGFTFTSTIEGNDGSVTYTPAETAEFLADVKAGNHDDLHRRARELS